MTIDERTKCKYFTVRILWGSTPELDERQPEQYIFDSKEELSAYLQGVDDACGWMDYEILSINGEDQ